MKPVQFCPFCEFTSKFPRAVVRHFLREHSQQDRVVLQEGDTLETSKKPGLVVFCWCGKFFYHRRSSRGPSPWERHLFANGGLCQHILALALEGRL